MAKAQRPVRIIGIIVVQIVKSGTTTQLTSLKGSEYLCCFVLSGARKALTETKLSKQFNICLQPWHEVTLPAQLLFLLCTGHHYDIFPQMMFARVRAAARGGDFQQQRGQSVFGHLTWVISSRTVLLNRPPEESLCLFLKEAQTLIPSAQF